MRLAHQLPRVQRIEKVDIAGRPAQHRERQRPGRRDAGARLVRVGPVTKPQLSHVRLPPRTARAHPAAPPASRAPRTHRPPPHAAPLPQQAPAPRRRSQTAYRHRRQCRAAASTPRHRPRWTPLQLRTLPVAGAAGAEHHRRTGRRFRHGRPRHPAHPAHGARRHLPPRRTRRSYRPADSRQRWTPPRSRGEARAQPRLFLRGTSATASAVDTLPLAGSAAEADASRGAGAGRRQGIGSATGNRPRRRRWLVRRP